MKLKERLSHFWNDTLGVDYEEEIDIENSQRPEDKELKQALEKVSELEKKYRIPNSSNGGKNAGKKIVEKVDVDNTKATEEAEKKAEQQKTVDEREER